MIRVLQKDLVKGRIYWDVQKRSLFKFIGNGYDERIYVWKFKYMLGPVTSYLVYYRLNRDGLYHFENPDQIWYWDSNFKFGR